MQHWLRALFGRQDGHHQDGHHQDGKLPFTLREAELRERFERLERLAVEADVIAHSDHPEDQPWDER
jgi:hypothetical protein